VDYHARLAEGIQFSSTLLDAERGIGGSERGLFGRIIDFVRAARLNPPHRQILRAAYRGRDKAMRLLASKDANSG